MRTNRMAPPRYARAPHDVSPGALCYWRNLQAVFVPAVGAGTLNGVREILHNLWPTSGYATPRGEANGPSFNTAAGAGTHFGIQSWMPTTAPIGVFAFLVRRDSSATIQHLIGNGAASQGGWSFQLNYGAGQIGLTRWNAGDNASTTLGAVPNTGGTPSCVGMSYDGTTVRLMLNGRFQSLASGALVAPSSNNVAVGKNTSSLQALVNTSVHVIYLWTRTVGDGEMLALMQDPWAPIRPRAPVFAEIAGSSTIARVTQIATEGLIVPPAPTVRETQLALEALIGLPVTARATQVLIEALIAAPSAPSTARLSTLILEALTQPDATARLTQLAVEVLTAPTPGVRVTQVDLEALLTTGDPTVRATQLSLEALVQVAALTPTYTGQLFPRGSPPPF